MDGNVITEIRNTFANEDLELVLEHVEPVGYTCGVVNSTWSLELRNQAL